MDKLKRIIENNRMAFDSEEPSENHFQKFESRLRSGTKKTKTPRIRFWKMAAAIFIPIVLLTALAAVLMFTGKNSVESVMADGFQKELSEAEQYFIYQVDQNISDINSQTDSTSEAYQEELYTELNEIDKSIGELKSELRKFPDDERVFNAIISNYQTKLDLTDLILSVTKDVDR